MKLINFYNILKNQNFNFLEYLEYLQTLKTFNFVILLINPSKYHFYATCLEKPIVSDSFIKLLLKACEEISKIIDVESEKIFYGEIGNLENELETLKELFPDCEMKTYYGLTRNGEDFLPFYKSPDYDCLTNKTIIDYLEEHEYMIGACEFEVLEIPKGLKDKIKIFESDCSCYTYIRVFNQSF